MDVTLLSQAASRFDVVRELGRGGMGVVYEVRDRERGFNVALKTLRDISAERLYRLKREFRAAADISHPHLVALYELFVDQGQGSFTMELVRGVDLMAWARPGDKSGRAVATRMSLTQGAIASVMDELGGQGPCTATAAQLTDATQATQDSGETGATRMQAAFDHDGYRRCDDARLREALVAVASGLRALHRAGVVHRDIKPSNVLVDPAGRAVLMDFGISVEAESDDTLGAAGTPAYMAPEQATGDAVTDAADWYSVGCLLYRGLNGRVPFSGTFAGVLAAKRSLDAVQALPWARGVPDDLRELCMALLDPEPSARPSAADVFAALSPSGSVHGGVVELDDDEVFVGRGLELARLREALDQARDHSVLAVVSGPSGIGKSSLVRRFITDAARDATHPLRVLSGRCHERETVPYKGFDGVVDDMVAALDERRVGDADDLTAIARLFPSVRAMMGTVADPGAQLAPADPATIRQRGFDALGRMLRAMAAERPLVVWVDDLQWADGDSIELLAGLLRTGDAGGGFLLVATRRDESSPIDDALGELQAGLPEGAQVALTVAPFTRAEEIELVSALMGTDALDSDTVEHFVGESRGIPLFLMELVRYATAHAQLDARPTYAQALTERVDALPAATRALLELSTVAGEPTRVDALSRAADVAGDDREKAINQLRVERLGRLTTRGGHRFLDTYHDRIREVLTDRRDAPGSASLHGELARALTELDAGSPDRLARHWAGAGDLVQATRYALVAAQQASDQLAFDRAAGYYADALHMGQLSPDSELTVLKASADALACAGRGYQAYEAYLRAAEMTTGEETQRLLEQAADQVLRSGHIAEAYPVIDTVLRGVGVRFPSSPGRAVVPLLYHRARLFFSGFDFKPPSRGIDPAQAGRVDLLASLALGLGFVDFLRGAYVNERAMRAALRLGERERVARAMAGWVIFRCAEGLGHRARTVRVMRRLTQLATECDAPYVDGWLSLARGWQCVFSGDVTGGLPDLLHADDRFTHDCVGAEWERSIAWYGVCACHQYRGDLELLDRSVHESLHQAQMCNSAYARSVLLAEPLAWTMIRRDQPELAIERLPEITAEWPTDFFTVAHFRQGMAEGWLRLYQERYREAVEVQQRTRRGLGVLGRVGAIKAAVALIEGTAAARCGDLRALRGARRALKQAARGAPRYINLYRYMVCLETWIRGDLEGAMTLMERTADALDEDEWLPQLAEGMRFAVGSTRGGDAGDALCRAAVTRMANKGARRPRRVLQMFGAPEPG